MMITSSSSSCFELEMMHYVCLLSDGVSVSPQNTLASVTEGCHSNRILAMWLH